jgi:hypothetical protein
MNKRAFDDPRALGRSDCRISNKAATPNDVASRRGFGARLQAI